MKSSIHFTIPLLITIILAACFGDDGDTGNAGWVKITEPTTLSAYTVNDTDSIIISGETFISPSAEEKEATVCNCVGFACFFMNDVQCITYTYYDAGVTVTVSNETTGDSATYSMTSRSGYITYWSVELPLKLDRNDVHVLAKDNVGNRGEARIIINSVDTIRPTVVNVSPENNSVVYVSSVITASFSEAIDPDSVTQNSFLVSDGTSNISGSIKVSDNNTSVTFTPTGNLAYDTIYTVTLTGDMHDPSRNALELLSWSFLTQLEVWQFGTINDDWAYSAASDATGNTYVTGMTSGDFTGAHAVGGYDAFLAKYDTGGVRLWLEQFGTLYDDRGKGVAIDADGNSYVSGGMYCDYTGSGYGGNCDAFLAKYDCSGMRLWLKQFGTDSLETVGGIALDANGNIYIAGATSGAFPNTDNPDNSDVFLAKFDAHGNLLWIRQFGSDDHEGANGIAVDADGNSYITGNTYGDIDGSGNAGSLDIFVARYDTHGLNVWLRQSGTATYEESHDIAVDTSGNSYVTGRTFGDFNNTTPPEQHAIYILKLDSSGNPDWVKQFGGDASHDTGIGVSTDNAGNVYVTGEMSHDVFISKHRADGEQLLMKHLGSLSNDNDSRGYGIDVDKWGTVHLSGYTHDGDLAGTGSAGNVDAFIARLRQ